jgi:hypothetical protein
MFFSEEKYFPQTSFAVWDTPKEVLLGAQLPRKVALADRDAK